MKLVQGRCRFSLASALALVACVPDFADDVSIISAPRILALRAEPAEAKPEAPVTLSALVAVPPDAAAAPVPAFALCLDRKPLTELGPVSPRCLEAVSTERTVLLSLGEGPSVTSSVPLDACRLFGPVRPEPKPGEPAGRPVDPDPSGGYYLPFVSTLPAGTPSLGAVRLACGLPGVTQAQLVEFNSRYRPSENPALVALAIVRDGAFSELPADSTLPEMETTVAPGEHLHLRANWASCPRAAECGDGVCGAREEPATCPADCSAPKGCTGAESYAWFDPALRAVTDRRESMRVAWFASGGQFAEERTGRSELQTEDFSDNTWTAPTRPGLVRLWLVLRDDRGGVGWQSYTIRVTN